MREYDLTAHRACRTDRSKIAQIMREEDDPDSDIMWEIELLASDINGTISSCLKPQPKDFREKIEELKNSSILRSKCVVKWLADEDNLKKYPDYVNYIMSLDNMNSCGIAYLEEMSRAEDQIK